MAACANCLICLSSSCPGTEAWFLVLGIVSPTTTTSSAALATGSTHRHKIMSDDAPADVSFKSDLTLIKCSLHAEAVFECAHACFDACSPPWPRRNQSIDRRQQSRHRFKRTIGFECLFV